MKKIWVPVVVLWLLPASYSLQRPAEPPENVQTAYEDPIRSQTQEAGEAILYFPDYVDGGGWSVQLALSNVDPDTGAEVVVEVYDEDGEPVPNLFDSGLTFDIPALGSRVLKSSGTGAIRRGWIQVRTDADSVSGLLTYREGRTEIEVSVEPAELGERFALFVEESDDVGAGVAVFKPEMASGIQLRVRDEEGNDPLEGAFVSRENFHQLAHTLPEWFTAEGIDRGFLSDFQGLLFLRAEDESPFAPLGLRFGKRSQSLSSVPAIRDETQEPMETTLYFPDYVDGSGWSVQLALSNIDAATAAEVSVEVFDEDGRTVRDLFDAGSVFRIPSLGSRVLKSAGAGAIRRGWIEVESDSASVSGLLTYRQAGSGVEVSVKPVELGSQFALFVEETSAVGAGVAIFKPDAAPNVELGIRDEEGNDPLEGVFIPRGDFHQLALTLPEWLGAGGVDTGFLSDFRGLLFIRSEDESQFAPLGLRFGKTNASLSSVPAIRIMDGDGIGGGQALPPTVTLSVAPSSIDWGDSATLTWSSTNAVSAEIAPDIGTVAASGSRKVSPRVTTTYRITVRGAGGRTETAAATVRVVVSDQAALRALYEFAGGTDWTNSGNWGTARPLGEWHGVRVDGQGRVIGLTLTDNGLSGGFPPELGALIHLTSLDLSNNALTGPIPPELGALVNLTVLVLDYNDLTGPIPAQLATFSNLTYLGLGGNNLTGPIPSELGSLVKLRGLHLSGNALEGSIPAELGRLVNLEWLHLSENDLTGPIPSELADLAQLRVLGLNHNALVGPIPPELGSLVSLERLELYDNALVGPIPAELGNLVNLDWLELGVNNLAGPIPSELGSLVKLRGLSLFSNALVGPIPQSFLQLDKLQTFYIRGNKGLCVPGVSAFVAWLEGIERRDESDAFCNESDRKVLASLFERAGGSGWTNADGWVSGPGLDNWYGVRADSAGRVAALDLERNGLSGRLPVSLGTLARMTELRIGGNTSLSGPLPLSLAALSLRALHYQGTGVCAPSQARFREWLNAIPSHEGTGAECPPLSDREILEIVYETLGGSEWLNSDNWLTDRPLRDWYGVEVDDQGRVITLRLTYNGLSGWIPRELGSLKHLVWVELGGGHDLAGTIPAELGDLANLRLLVLFETNIGGTIPVELGNLANLERLDLVENNLEGAIPAELGRLRNLRALNLSGNQLSGTVPVQLGSLSYLRYLNLSNNELTGPIPARFGNLSHLQVLSLSRNRLSGPLPAGLGGLARLEELHVGDNELHGTVPVEFRGLTSLREFSLQGNADMSGPLPAELAALGSLETLVADGTGLCAPSGADFLNWLGGLPHGRVPLCGSRAATAYLVQTVQSREFPVPLVAGEEALLRAFVTATQANQEPRPRVRASFHVGAARVHVAEIPASTGPIPADVEQGSLAASANAVIPADVIRPGLEMVIEIDPDGTLDPGLGVARRIPETGRLPVDVRQMPVLDLTVIPFLWSADPDSAVLGQTAGMAADPHGHELLYEIRTLLPVGALDVTAHAPVLSSSNNMFDLFRETRAIRALEAGSGYWMGMMSGPLEGSVGGLAASPGRVSTATPRDGTIAHELGHNMSLKHAPCGGANGPDPAFPYRDGSSGVWGYDFDRGRMVHPSTPDIMSYCSNPHWISDYHFTKALHFRLADEGSGSDAMVAEPAASLMLWGGVDADGAPFMEPAFAVDAPPLLPDSAGDYRIIGTAAGGETLFSISFPMPHVADADGASSFVFVMPARAAWQATLAAITLTGPGGTAALNGDSNRPMAILRDPRTGQVRGILRDPPAAAQVAGDLAERTAGPGLDMLFSRGVPDAGAWSRAGEGMQ